MQIFFVLKLNQLITNTYWQVHLVFYLNNISMPTFLFYDPVGWLNTSYNFFIKKLTYIHNHCIGIAKCFTTILKRETYITASCQILSKLKWG